ncbi:MAG TPA: hypothetical protein VJA21_12215 [Verrucomicrobiae bacterium]
MKKYIEISPPEKLKLLNEHPMGTTWKSLDESKWCLHCEAQFTGHSVLVYKQDGEFWLECGTPDCDGSPLDWTDCPWWNENHPQTKAHDEAMERIDEITESGDPEQN